MIELNDRSEAIDVVTVKDRLEQRKSIRRCWGGYLSDLALAVPTAANIVLCTKDRRRKNHCCVILIQTATGELLLILDLNKGEEVNRYQMMQNWHP